MKKLCPKCNCEWEGYYEESPSNHFCPPPQTDEIPYSEWQSLGSKIADVILEKRK
jgi:hypothetical protein